jgi:uncharacterized protein (UPF0548 family)
VQLPVEGGRELEDLQLTYAAVGDTAVADEAWGATPDGFRRDERTVPVAATWEDACATVLRWGVKTRSGFHVSTDLAVHEGANVWVRLRVGKLTVTEPVRVVAVVDGPLRCGFSYGTLEGHPISGEEAFVVHRATEHAPVQLTIRSLTRAAPTGTWRYAFPLLLGAQRTFRRRYLRSLDA